MWRKWAPVCANSRCAGNSILHAITRRRRGMTVDGEWYCDADCFEQAIQGKIGELMTFQGKAVKARSSRVPLGLTLLQKGVLTPEQLRVALEHHRTTALNFGEVVQQLGFATAEQVTSAVAAQWACPVFSLGDRPLEIGVRIPRHLMELYGMLPVHYGELERRLLIAFVSGVQHHVLYTIGYMTGCTVAPCFVTAREYQFQLHSPATPFLRDHELVFDKIVEAAEIAQISKSYVVQLDADQVRLGKCRDYLWTRISGRNREMDLLFRRQAT